MGKYEFCARMDTPDELLPAVRRKRGTRANKNGGGTTGWSRHLEPGSPINEPKTNNSIAQKTFLDVYGVLVHSCYVEDGQGEKQLIVDAKG